MMEFYFKSPYALAFWIVKTCRNFALPIFLVALGLFLGQWALDFLAFDYDGPLKPIMFIVFAIKWRVFSFFKMFAGDPEGFRSFWMDYRIILWFGSLVWFIWLHVFMICFLGAVIAYEIKGFKISGARRAMDKNPSPNILGLDLLNVREMDTTEHVKKQHLEVFGNEDHLSNVLQRVLEADIYEGRSIILLAPEGERKILRQVTKVLRGQPPAKLRTLFFFSLKERALSASYSPFYKGSPNLL